MKYYLRKVASVLASAALMGSTAGFAAAVTYPAPFVQGSTSDVAIVVGSAAQPTDTAAALDLGASLASQLSTGGGVAGTTPEGGDFTMLDKPANHLNIGDALSTPLGATVNDDDLTEMLADGVYVADDSDNFDYEQKIILGASVLAHWRDSDYEDIIGVDERTPTVGINITSGKHIMNFSIDFIEDAESDIVSGDLDDIEGSDIPMLGKTYFVSDFKNAPTKAGTLGKLTLLDSADKATVSEGETVTLSAGGTSYDVSIQYVDSNSAKLTVNDATTNDLAAGETEKLSDGSYIGIREVTKLEVAGEVGTVEFSIGSGKVEITSASDIKVSDDTITDVKGWVYSGSGTATTNTTDKIELEWLAEDDIFITPETELEFPGLGGIKFSMNELVRSEEEAIKVEPDGDTSFRLSIPIKDGTANINILYANASGEFIGVGKSATERLATTNNSVLTYWNKVNSNNFHKYAVVTYNTSTDWESYLLSFDTSYDSSAKRNETTIKNEVTGETWENYAAGQVFDIGSASFTISAISHSGVSAGNESLNLTGGSNTYFQTIISKGGAVVYLPVAHYDDDATGTEEQSVYLNMGADENLFPGYINFSNVTDRNAIGNGTAGNTVNGFNAASVQLSFDFEDKDDNLGSGGALINMTLDDSTSTAGKVEVTQIEGTGTGGATGLEMGDSDNYEYYVRSDVAPRFVHYTGSDNSDYATVFYPSGESETYAEIFLTATTATIGTESGNIVPIEDSEAGSVNTKNLIVVGGSCVNTVAATLLGSSAPLCEDGFTGATGVGSGEYLIETFSNAAVSSKLATLVAGYNAADTTNAVNALKTSSVEIAAGKKYTGDTSSGPTEA